MPQEWEKYIKVDDSIRKNPEIMAALNGFFTNLKGTGPNGLEAVIKKRYPEGIKVAELDFWKSYRGTHWNAKDKTIYLEINQEQFYLVKEGQKGGILVTIPEAYGDKQFRIAPLDHDHTVAHEFSHVFLQHGGRKTLHILGIDITIAGGNNEPEAKQVTNWYLRRTHPEIPERDESKKAADIEINLGLNTLKEHAFVVVGNQQIPFAEYIKQHPEVLQPPKQPSPQGILEQNPVQLRAAQIPGVHNQSTISVSATGCSISSPTLEL